MSFVRPHPPFDPPQAYLDLYDGLDLPDPVVGDWAKLEDPELAGLNPTTFGGNVPRRRLKKAIAAYYALITHLDHQIGRFFQAMEEYGVMHNTIVLFASDHGELLGDHHLFRKALAYEGSAKVPFILSDPGDLLHLRRGTTVDNVVELRDIMPTLLDIVDVPIPTSVDGKSVLPLGQNSPTVWRDYIHGEHAYGNMSHHYVTDGTAKYIWYSQTGEEQLFNLQVDPMECVNVVADGAYADQLRMWRERLIHELEGREEGYVKGGKLQTGCAVKACLNHILQ
jgi:arylsulfatase A-like enzyme